MVGVRLLWWWLVGDAVCVGCFWLLVFGLLSDLGVWLDEWLFVFLLCL